MLKKIGKIGLALVLILGLLPIMSLRVYAAVPSFNETTDFVIEPPVTYSAGKNLSAAQGLPDGGTAVLLNSFVYEGNTYVSSNFLRIFDNTGTLITDINLSSLMDTYYKMTDVNMLVLNNGNLLITYNKSDAGENNLQLGTVTESTPNTYFMVLDKAGHKVTTQTQINTFSDGSLPQLTRFVSATELSDGNIAFSWQRNDNVSTATRVFTVGGTPVSSETLLVKYNASMSYVSAGDGVYMVAYNSGASADYIYLKVFSNSGTLIKTIDVGARTNEKQLYLSTLNNGDFMFSQYYWVNDRSTVSLYDNAGNSQGGFEVNGYLGEASAAVYKDGAQPGFVTVSTDPISNAVINEAYNYGTEWSGTQYAYLNYYDYGGNLILTSDQPVDSAPVVFQGYDEDSWMFDVEYYPKFALYPAFGDKVVLIKTDNTDATNYRIIGKLFDTEPSTPVALLSAAADGVAGTTTSTKIDLTFDTAIAGLTADDITITNGAGSAVKGTLSGSGTDWSIGLTSVTTEGDVSVAVNSPSGYTISGSPMTVTVSLFTALPEATPAAVIDYAAEQLTGLTANGSYTVNGTLAVTATAEGKLAIDSSWLGMSLNIVKKGNGSTTIDSAAQTVNIPVRPAAPTGLAATDETAISAEDGTLTGVSTTMEYKRGIAGAWVNVAGTTVTELAPDTYYVRTKGTSSAFVSEAQSVTVAAFVPTQEATPAAVIDYAAEQLTGLTANGSYTVNGTLAVTATAEGKLAIDSSWLGTQLSIVKKGNGSTTIDSAAQTVNIPVRPAAPAGLAATDETAISAEDGTLTGVSTTMEYKRGIAGAWVNVAGTTVTELAPDTYYVRTKGTSSAFVSEAQSVTVAAFVPTQEATPAAVIDYAAEQLTGLTANGSYTVNGTQAVTATAEGKLAIDSSWLGTPLSIVKKGNGSTTIDSVAQTVNIPVRPAAPAGVAATDETKINGNDGTLTNVTSAMEYKKGTLGAWVDVTGTTVTELAPDTYYIRTKVTSVVFASEAQSVTVAAFVPTQEATPAAVIDYAAEQLTGLTANGSYTVNGTLAVTATADGKLAIDSSWLGTPLSIVKKGNGSTTIDSAAQTVNIPVRPAAPTGVLGTDETALNANDGTLTNVTTAMEYKKGTAGTWIDVTGTTVTALVPDTYYVRTKATTTAFISASVQLTVLSFTATAEATPAAEIDYAAEQLTGLAPNGAYTINGTQAVTATADGKLALDSNWLGTSLSIVKKGNASTTTDSAVQTLSLPSRPAAPVGVTVTDVTYNGANDGTLQNLTVQMEYKIGSSGLWTDVADTILTGLAPGTYYVREKATATAFASNAAQITVHDSNAVIPAAPEVTADDQNNTIVGLDTSMEFSVDDGSFIRYDGTNLPDLNGEHTVKVRVASSGSVPAGPATTLTFTINAPIPAEGLSVSASDPSGAANNGYTQINVTPAPAAGHKLLYKNFGTGSVVVPNVGDILSGYTLIGMDGLIPAANGDMLGIAEADADDKVIKYGSATAVVVAAEPVTPDPDPVSPGTGSNPGSGTSTGNAASNVTDVIVLVNGKEENAGKATTTTSGNLKITTIAVDPAKLQAKLDAEGNGAVVTIPMMLDSNIIIAELNGQMIKNMENVSATLVLQTSKGTYTLPASEINIGALAERLGNGMKLEDITLRITIGEAPASMNQVVTAAAGRGGFTLIAPPIDFTVTASYGTSIVEVNRFNAYVERTVALPDGIDPNRITTGIVVDPDGTVRHVPTRLVRKDGRYYADIKSLTNSSYAVVWHPLTFADVDNHWAKNAVNDMGSRLVINGVNETTFNPDADITRAEFAAIIVRGLGLKLEEGPSAFADIPADSWYAAVVETASEYGLITGFEDGTFRPDARITREQAMNIIAKAMKLTGLAEQTGPVDTASVLAAFTDAGSVGAWAGESLALAAKAGLITGRGGSKLEAKDNVTRAEVAVLIQRLLQKSELID
ncbi:S-layer homology domain-containing protein [Paenibacillus borealis]|uniref:S-layer homology domain-containing protein n=1 Tax=Paenibacillus borealis TaxID=160799 RepID=UPI0006933D2F|nr:S-layer homology domain-containing protein [Paenibacillus borealis]